MLAFLFSDAMLLHTSCLLKSQAYINQVILMVSLPLVDIFCGSRSAKFYVILMRYCIN